jgi:hypothetical protein
MKHLLNQMKHIALREYRKKKSSICTIACTICCLFRALIINRLIAHAYFTLLVAAAQKHIAGRTLDGNVAGLLLYYFFISWSFFLFFSFFVCISVFTYIYLFGIHGTPFFVLYISFSFRARQQLFEINFL